MKGEIRPDDAWGARYPGRQRPNPPHVAHRLEDLAIPVYRNRGGEIPGPIVQTSTGFMSYRASRDVTLFCRADVDRSLICCFLVISLDLPDLRATFTVSTSVVDNTSVACYPRKALQVLADSGPAVPTGRGPPAGTPYRSAGWPRSPDPRYYVRDPRRARPGGARRRQCARYYPLQLAHLPG